MRRVSAISGYLESSRKGKVEGKGGSEKREREEWGERRGREVERERGKKERVMDCWRDCKQFVKLCK